MEFAQSQLQFSLSLSVIPVHETAPNCFLTRCVSLVFYVADTMSRRGRRGEVSFNGGTNHSLVRNSLQP